MKKLLSRVLAVALALLTLSTVAAVTASALEPHGNDVLIRNWVRNDPNYTFSDAYKTSVWYENFNELELTQNTRNNILRIALSQLGYHEGDSADDFDGMNTGGTSNYIEYARLIVPNYNDNHYEWCACFVNWCLSQARVDYAYGEIGCWKWAQWLKANDMFEDSAAYGGTYTPQPADMIFFNWDGDNTGSSHIGLVLYVTDTKIYTIEGNNGNQVAIHSYRMDDTDVIGFGTPAYPENDEPTIDFSCANEKPLGRYILNTANVRLIDDANVDGQLIRRLQLGSTVILLGVEDKYAHVRIGEEEGYVLATSLQLLTPYPTITFVADGQTVATINTLDGQLLAEQPAVPQKDGYTGTWRTYTIGQEDITVEAIYSPIYYTIAFVADGQTIKTASFTVESPFIDAPEVPAKEGFTGEWETYTLSPTDMTVQAIYTSLAGPETETVTEHESESGTEPATEPVTESESVTEPVTEPTTTPVTESESDTATESETTGEDAGCFASVGILIPVLSMLICLAVLHLPECRRKEQE